MNISPTTCPPDPRSLKFNPAAAALVLAPEIVTHKFHDDGLDNNTASCMAKAKAKNNRGKNQHMSQRRLSFHKKHSPGGSDVGDSPTPPAKEKRSNTEISTSPTKESATIDLSSSPNATEKSKSQSAGRPRLSKSLGPSEASTDDNSSLGKKPRSKEKTDTVNIALFDARKKSTNRASHDESSADDERTTNGSNLSSRTDRSMRVEHDVVLRTDFHGNFVQVYENEVGMLSSTEASADTPVDSLLMHYTKLHEAKCTDDGMLHVCVPVSSAAGLMMCEDPSATSNYLEGLGVPSFIDDQYLFLKKGIQVRFEVIGSDVESTSPEPPIPPENRAPDDGSTTSGSSGNLLQNPTSHFHSNYIVVTKEEDSDIVRVDSFYADSSRSNANKSYAQSISSRILYGIENMWPDAQMNYLNCSKNPIRINFPENQQDLTCWAYALASISCLNALPAGFTKTDAEN